jgi:peptide/nickel transport system substrate-binding protein
MIGGAPPGRCWAMILPLMVQLLLSACGSSQERAHLEAERKASLNIAILGTRVGANYNFLSPTNFEPPPGLDLVYESLISMSPSSGWRAAPWLALSWEWSDEGRHLVFRLRHDVTWSDGAPFTANDVKFTLDLMQRYPQLSQGAPGSIVSVTAPDAWSVDIAYREAAYSGFKAYRDIRILPEHVWSRHDPLLFTNPAPVGTGPFVLERFSYQLVRYRLRTDYWGGTSRGVQFVQFQAAGTPDSIRQYLLSGFVDYAKSELIGNPRVNFVALDRAHNHYWLASPGSSWAISFNNAQTPTDNVHVRRALYAAISPQQLIALAPAIADVPANITGINAPAFGNWVAASFREQFAHQDGDAARTELRDSGYTVVNGQLSKGGRAVPLTVLVPAGNFWGDALAQQWREVLGLNVDVEQTVELDNRLAEGRFQLAAPAPDVPGLGAPPSVAWNIATPRPIGASASSNWERAYAPEAVDLARQVSATNDEALQKDLLFRIEAIMAENRFTGPLVPYSWTMAYSSQHWSGWPDPASPYCVPAAGRSDLIKLALALTPADGT